MLKEKYVLSHNINPYRFTLFHYSFDHFTKISGALNMSKVKKKKVNIYSVSMSCCHFTFFSLFIQSSDCFGSFVFHIYLLYTSCLTHVIFLNVCILTYKDSEGKHAGSEETFWLTPFSSF